MNTRRAPRSYKVSLILGWFQAMLNTHLEEILFSCAVCTNKIYVLQKLTLPNAMTDRPLKSAIHVKREITTGSLLACKIWNKIFSLAYLNKILPFLWHACQSWESSFCYAIKYIL